MKDLIDSKEVAKLMKEAAKECAMTRVYSSTDNVWWAKEEELAKGGVEDYECNYNCSKQRSKPKALTPLIMK